MEEKQAMQIASKYAHADKLYILLSVKQADMIRGVSIPYVGMMQDGNKILFIFSSYEFAKEYINKNGYEKLDEIYTIGAIEKNHKYNSLENICNFALNMGISRIDFDATTSEVFGCEIRWFMKSNQMTVAPLSMLLSEKECNNIINKNDTKIQMNFNQLPIEGFSNPYLVTEKRRTEVLRHVFNGSNVDEYILNFHNNESLVENCFVMDFMNSKMIPQARHDGKQNDVDYFTAVSTILSAVIKEKVVLLKNLYTLKNNQSNEIYVRNNSAYLVYTDRFKYMGSFEYVHLNKIDDFLEFVALNNIQNIIVTDGPNYIAILEAKLFFKNQA